MSKPGEVRNPKGRPKGTRYKLASIDEMEEDWMAFGADVTVKCGIRERGPNEPT